jgi:hypothetical protein
LICRKLQKKKKEKRKKKKTSIRPPSTDKSKQVASKLRPLPTYFFVSERKKKDIIITLQRVPGLCPRLAGLV